MQLKDAKWAAERLGVGLPRLYELARSGAIPGLVRLGKKSIRFDPQALEIWIAAGGKPLANSRASDPEQHSLPPTAPVA